MGGPVGIALGVEMAQLALHIGRCLTGNGRKFGVQGFERGGFYKQG